MTVSSVLKRAAAEGNVQSGEVMVHDRKTWADSMREAAQELSISFCPPTIVYSSRTHSQLAQVMGELRNTTYK